MINAIEKLRRGPEKKKKRAAMLLSAVFTIGVFFAWLFVTLNAPEPDIQRQSKGPVAGLVENFNAGVKEIVRMAKNVF